MEKVTVKKNFSGYRVAFGTMLFIFFSQGVFGSNGAVYVLLAENYNVSLTLVGTFMSVMTIVGTLLGLFVTTVKKKIGIKNCLFIAAFAMIIEGILIKVIGANPLGLFINNVFKGFDLAFGTFAIMTEIVCNWFEAGKARSDRIAFNSGGALIGSAILMFIGGQLIKYVSLFDYYLIMDTGAGLVMLIIAIIFIKAGKPSDLGQEPYKEVLAAPVAAPVEEAAQETIAELPAVNAVKPKSIYANPIFWFAIIATFAGAAGVSYVGLYAPMFFSDNGGMEYTMAVNLVSFMSLCAALLSFVSGKMITTLKTKKYLFFVYIMGALANALMIIYQRVPYVPIIAFIVVAYAVGSGIGNVNNLVVPNLFDKEQAMNANSKVYAVILGAYILLSPLTAFVLERFGYDALYIVLCALNGIALIAYLMAIRFAKKQGLSIS